MSQVGDNPLVTVLMLIGREAPQPWYYRKQGKETGLDSSDLDAVLELLWLEGLVRREGTGSSETGPGVSLTPFGEQVAADPVLLAKLRQGEALKQGDPGAIARQGLLREARPTVTRVIIALNVLVFLYGAYLASGRNVLEIYLSGFSKERGAQERYFLLLLEMGASLTPLILTGEWWRLITSTFLHRGVLHIGMNMFAMNNLGKFAEQTWGSWRLAIIYCLAGWAGSCCAAAYGPGGVGASGAICGVMGAEGVWVALYGRHLPRTFTRQLRTQFFTNVVFLTFISLMPGISWQGHLGGAVGGALAGLLLHLHRFGRSPLRWVALAAIVPIVWGCYAWMLSAAANSKEGRAIVQESYAEKYGQPARKQARKVMSLLQRKFNPLYEQHPTRRDPKEVDTTIQAIAEEKQELEDLLQKLQTSRPVDRLKVVKESATELLQEAVSLCDSVTEYLKKGEEVKRADEQRIEQRFEKVDDLEHQLGQKLAELANEDAQR